MAGDVIRATVSGDRTRVVPIAAAVEQHPAEHREIGRRAEEARVAGDAAHAARRRIVHDAAQHRLPGPSQGQPYCVQACVGAMRFASDGGGRNIVSCMPSGPKNPRLHHFHERLFD